MNLSDQNLSTPELGHPKPSGAAMTLRRCVDSQSARLDKTIQKWKNDEQGFQLHVLLDAATLLPTVEADVRKCFKAHINTYFKQTWKTVEDFVHAMMQANNDLEDCYKDLLGGGPAHPDAAAWFWSEWLAALELALRGVIASSGADGWKRAHQKFHNEGPKLNTKVNTCGETALTLPRHGAMAIALASTPH